MSIKVSAFIVIFDKFDFNFSKYFKKTPYLYHFMSTAK
jgi:hypothetical protein